MENYQNLLSIVTSTNPLPWEPGQLPYQWHAISTLAESHVSLCLGEIYHLRSTIYHTNAIIPLQPSWYSFFSPSEVSFHPGNCDSVNSWMASDTGSKLNRLSSTHSSGCSSNHFSNLSCPGLDPPNMMRPSLVLRGLILNKFPPGIRTPYEF